ncbi:SCO family protein [Leptospira wolffii]|uniref:SCO family protein n=1 Tax=Leptospira wolffii TaxID=409998 RepID=UPI0002E79870|nr:SCO family protein [Leptospira wolffii]EPG65935.1 SCO1/SenC domain protein [Leptospira wolffii serovar Khorat str. Khorat-H2]
MESNRWKFALATTIGILPLVFLISHNSSPMIQAEKDVPEETLILSGKEKPISLRSVLEGKQSFVYFGSLESRTEGKENLKKFLSWMGKIDRKNAQFVFITLAPEKDDYNSLKEKLGSISERILLLKPKNSSSAFEIARSFGIQAYIVPELGNLKFDEALIWVDESPKIRGIFPKFAENPDSIRIPEFLVQAK